MGRQALTSSGAEIQIGTQALTNSSAEIQICKKDKFPHTLVIIFVIIIFSAILTHFIPAGQYNRIEDIATGRTIVDSSSYQEIESSPAGIKSILTSIPRGMQQTAWIAFFILIVGGTFKTIESTGAIQAFLSRSLQKAKGKSIIAIPLIIFLFTLLPAFMGNMESYLAFVPIGILLARSLGFDALVGISIIIAAGNVGLTSGIMNPFTVGVAHGITGLPMFSGMWFRVIGFILMYSCVTFWTVKYAIKIKKDPTKSLIYDIEQDAKKDGDIVMPKLDKKKVMILITFLLGIGYIVYGAVTQTLDFKTEAPAIFILITIIVGIVARYSPNKIATEFVNGAKAMVMGALVLGFAKGISVVLLDANVIDTIVHLFSNMLIGMPMVISAVFMYIFQFVLNFFIISGTGQALTTVPIMSPLGEVIGLTQQTVVTAFQYGDGIANLLLPMSPTTIGACILAKVAYPTFVKFIWRIIVTNALIGGVLVATAALINLGPF